MNTPADKRDLQAPSDETMAWLAAQPSGKLVNILRDAGRISYRPEDMSMLAQLIERIRLSASSAERRSGKWCEQTGDFDCPTLSACMTAGECQRSAPNAAQPMYRVVNGWPEPVPSAPSSTALNVTVWKDGSYLCQSQLDDEYCRNDPDWLCSIPLVPAYTVSARMPKIIGIDPARPGGDFTGYACSCGQIRVDTDGPCDRADCPIRNSESRTDSKKGKP